MKSMRSAILFDGPGSGFLCEVQDLKLCLRLQGCSSAQGLEVWRPFLESVVQYPTVGHRIRVLTQAFGLQGFRCPKFGLLLRVRGPRSYTKARCL